MVKEPEGMKFVGRKKLGEHTKSENLFA